MTAALTSLLATGVAHASPPTNDDSDQAIEVVIPFTATQEDATHGNVTFRAVAELSGPSDALPQDNEVINTATAVSPATTSGLDIA
ncbi:hypothetical protein ACQPYE_26505 [Actinosynnema sp. CA-299493]